MAKAMALALAMATVALTVEQGRNSNTNRLKMSPAAAAAEAMAMAAAKAVTVVGDVGSHKQEPEQEQKLERSSRSSCWRNDPLLVYIASISLIFLCFSSCSPLWPVTCPATF